MSIAAGFVCHDGLVLSADREIGNDAFKYYDHKIFPISLAPGTGAVVLTYAGLPEVMKSICEEMRGRIEDKVKTCAEVRVELQKTLDTVLPTKSKGRHQMICAICAEPPNHIMLKTDDRKISPIPTWDFVGFGDGALVRYLAGIFLKTGLRLSISRAALFCNYIIGQAKKYVQWCGGPTDIVALTEAGIIEHEFTLYTKQVEMQLDNADYRVSLLLNTIMDKQATSTDCDKAIREFADFLKDLGILLRGHS